MHVANPSLGFHFPAPNTSLQDAEGPIGVGRAHCPAASRAHGLRPQGQALAHTFELSFFLMGCKYRSQYPSQKSGHRKICCPYELLLEELVLQLKALLTYCQII